MLIDFSFKQRMLLALTISAISSSLSLADITDSARAKKHQEIAKSLEGKLGRDHGLRMDRSRQDEIGMTHVHFKQLYKGVPVFGGDVITHIDKNAEQLKPTESLFKDINIDTRPTLTSNQAITIARKATGSDSIPKLPPKSELVVYPRTELIHVGPGTDATSYERRVIEYRLAFKVQIHIESPTELSKTVSIVDAKTGTILKQWNDLHTANAVGVGQSQYSGTVQINTNSLSSGFELRDVTRGLVPNGNGVGNIVKYFNIWTDNGNFNPAFGEYIDGENTWGDGQILTTISPSSLISATGQTAAVDVAYGVQATWDMYKNVFGRSGIDGAGTATISYVHYAGYDTTTPFYNNAYWNGSYMAFGDGKAGNHAPFTTIDIVGHEFSHGVTEYNGLDGLVYEGESGGLNESSSDIMGEMAQFYAYGGGYAVGATIIPSVGGNWTHAEGSTLQTPAGRYLYKPSKDGKSVDAWYPEIGEINVHYSSGPGNRQFYFLSQGASNISTSDFYSSYLPSGMAGIGNDRAAKIHYRALTTYYTSTMNYADARAAYLSAAEDLHGSNSAEYRAVMNSFAAINVGTRAPLTPLMSIITDYLVSE